MSDRTRRRRRRERPRRHVASVCPVLLLVCSAASFSPAHVRRRGISMQKKRSAFSLMHSEKARPKAYGNARRRKCAQRGASPLTGRSQSKYWSYFLRTACSVDATLLLCSRGVERGVRCRVSSRPMGSLGDSPPCERSELYQNQSGMWEIRWLLQVFSGDTSRPPRI